MARLAAAVGWQGRERVDRVEHRHLGDFLTAIAVDGRTAAAPAPGAVPDDLAVPPTLLCGFVDEPPECPAALAYGQGWLNGGDRFEYPEAAPELRLGDVLRSRTELVEAVEKAGRSGRMAVLTFRTEFRRDDTGEVVARHVGTRIRR
jgi:hypothetical protein